MQHGGAAALTLTTGLFESRAAAGLWSHELRIKDRELIAKMCPERKSRSSPTSVVAFISEHIVTLLQTACLQMQLTFTFFYFAGSICEIFITP